MARIIGRFKTGASGKLIKIAVLSLFAYKIYFLHILATKSKLAVRCLWLRFIT
jgi:hypothetical protein